MFTATWPLFIIVGLAVVVILVMSRKKLRRASSYVEEVTAGPDPQKIKDREETLSAALNLMKSRGEPEEYQLEVLRNMKATGNLPPCLKDLDLTDLALVRETLDASIAARNASR